MFFIQFNLEGSKDSQSYYICYRRGEEGREMKEKQERGKGERRERVGEEEVKEEEKVVVLQQSFYIDVVFLFQLEFVLEDF